jgi:hypothetical protein
VLQPSLGNFGSHANPLCDSQCVEVKNFNPQFDGGPIRASSFVNIFKTLSASEYTNVGGGLSSQEP